MWPLCAVILTDSWTYHDSFRFPEVLIYFYCSHSHCLSSTCISKPFLRTLTPTIPWVRTDLSRVEHLNVHRGKYWTEVKLLNPSKVQRCLFWLLKYPNLICQLIHATSPTNRFCWLSIALHMNWKFIFFSAEQFEQDFVFCCLFFFWALLRKF